MQLASSGAAQSASADRLIRSFMTETSNDEEQLLGVKQKRDQLGAPAPVSARPLGRAPTRPHAP